MRGGGTRTTREGYGSLNKKRRDRYAEQTQRDRFGKKKIQEIYPEQPPKEETDAEEL